MNPSYYIYCFINSSRTSTWGGGGGGGGRRLDPKIATGHGKKKLQLQYEKGNIDTLKQFNSEIFCPHPSCL